MTDNVRELDGLLTELRPQLHRYCARMVGSAVDGEDIVQDAALKAVAAWQSAGPTANVPGWLFRIAHNTALDFLRSRQRHAARYGDEDTSTMAAPDVPAFDMTVIALRTFLRLPALQRSAVILRDVLGHSLAEAASITGASGPATKASLQRGRARLREIATEPEADVPIVLPEHLRARLLAYADRFTTGDFDAVRAMLADDVRLDLVARAVRTGRSEVSEYYERYAACDRWAYAAGVIEGRPALLVYDREVSLETPTHFAALGFADEGIVTIHDFLFAGYALEGVVVQVIRK